jgi:hypothetical protein
MTKIFRSDVIGFCRDALKYREVLDSYMLATGMEVDVQKSSILFNGIQRAGELAIKALLSYSKIVFNNGLKYLGFTLKANECGFHDWLWLYTKNERRIATWCNRWLSLGGRLTLVKPVLDATPVYWHLLTYIPVGIQKKIRKLLIQFLWSGKKENDVIPLVNWKRISKPEMFGGWRLKLFRYLDNYQWPRAFRDFVKVQVYGSKS